MKDRAERKIRYSVAPTNFDKIILKFDLISAEYYFAVEKSLCLSRLIKKKFYIYRILMNLFCDNFAKIIQCKKQI